MCYLTLLPLNVLLSFKRQNGGRLLHWKRRSEFELSDNICKGSDGLRQRPLLLILLECFVLTSG